MLAHHSAGGRGLCQHASCEPHAWRKHSCCIQSTEAPGSLGTDNRMDEVKEGATGLLTASRRSA